MFVFVSWICMHRFEENYKHNGNTKYHPSIENKLNEIHTTAVGRRSWQIYKETWTTLNPYKEMIQNMFQRVTRKP